MLTGGGGMGGERKGETDSLFVGPCTTLVPLAGTTFFILGVFCLFFCNERGRGVAFTTIGMCVMFGCDVCSAVSLRDGRWVGGYFRN